MHSNGADPKARPAKGIAPAKAVKGKRSSHMLERMVETYFPYSYKLLQLMHMEHVLQLKNKLRAMLMLSCLISLVFIFTWVSDIVNLSCFQKTPWTEEGLGRWTCLYQAIGCVVFVWMFKNSLVALCNYDDQHEELRLKKKKILHETRQHCEEVLKRAQQKADQLCDLLATMLASDIRSLVNKMKTILQEAATKYGDHDVYQRLVVAMATHLHDLRSPVLLQFSKLIEMCHCENQFLLDQLIAGQKQSMIGLLIGGKQEQVTALIGRAGTMHDEDEFHEVVGQILPAIRARRKAWCFGCLGGAAQRQNNALKIVLSKQDEAAIQKKYTLQPGDPVERVVLCPVHILLAWLGKAKPISPNTDDGEEDALPQPSMRRWFTLGVFFCVAYAVFYAFTVKELATLISDGSCGVEVISCAGAMMIKSIGVVAMAIYVFSMIAVIRQIDKVDASLQATQDIKDLEDFKHAIDSLNTYIPASLAKDAGDAEGAQFTMLAEIASRLRVCEALIDEHMDSGYGAGVDISRYQELLRRLTDRHDSVASGESRRLADDDAV